MFFFKKKKEVFSPASRGHLIGRVQRSTRKLSGFSARLIRPSLPESKIYVNIRDARLTFLRTMVRGLWDLSLELTLPDGQILFLTGVISGVRHVFFSHVLPNNRNCTYCRYYKSLL